MQFDYQALNNEVQIFYSQIIKAKDINSGLKLYINFYNNIIKKKEEVDHYNKCFEIINEKFKIYLDYFFPELKNNFLPDDNTNHICIFMPNIINNLAHIEFLGQILDSGKPDNTKIYIAGNYSNEIEIAPILKNLYKKKIIEEFIRVNLLDIESLNLFIRRHSHKFKNFIIWALPLIIPFWVRIFKERCIYASLKFEYNSFNSLQHAISFEGNKLNDTKKLKNTDWHRLQAPFIDYKFNLHKKSLDKNHIKLITVNREEKINNTQFLESVASILKNNQNTYFYWTGRNKNKEIEQFFIDHDVSEKTSFIGWVDIQKITNQFDIFLDTPHLSGLVALNAFVYGIPVVSFKNSNSYINIYSNELEVAFNHSFVSPTPEDYIQYVWDLCHKNDFYEKVREYQIQSKNIFKENQTKNINRVFFNTLNKINKKI